MRISPRGAPTLIKSLRGRRPCALRAGAPRKG